MTIDYQMKLPYISECVISNLILKFNDKPHKLKKVKYLSKKYIINNGK